jgi:hypothetical protein
VRRKSTEKQPTPLPPPDVISGKNIRERKKEKEKCERKRGKIKGREKFKLPE